MAQTVYLGMSGGVDSALAAALLVEQGLDVHAVYMRNWSRDLPGFKCTWADDLADAERVAVSLGIDLEVWDCEEEYKRTVVDYLVDSYARGYTPNPDVMCNQTVKFGTFAERAFAEGADLIATGHYARVRHEAGTTAGTVGTTGTASASRGLSGGERATDATPAAGTASASRDPLASSAADEPPARLLRAADEHKDQTYFLWRVPGQTFNRVLFPVGDIPSKAIVRQMCAERGLGVERKPDSDGICFVGEVGIRTFLLDALDRRPGSIVEWETGRVLGRHDGAFLFTIGQRKGLNLGGGPARYVVRTDTRENVVYVSADHDCPALFTRELALEDCRWLAGEPPEDGTYLVRTRHTGELRPARVSALPGGHARVEFAEPQRVVAPGQSCVVYRGLECLGGGIVSPDLREHPVW